jgi:hypothetical protein
MKDKGEVRLKRQAFILHLSSLILHPSSLAHHFFQCHTMRTTPTEINARPTMIQNIHG